MKKWVVKNIRDNNIKDNNNLISNLLYFRGIKSPSEVENFLKPSIDGLYNPFLLKDMDRAIDRIDAAIKGREKIIVYGDYDVDGITSTSILLRAFKRLGVDAGYYIPDRINEGYGINIEAIDYIKSLEKDLIITVDCGVSSINEVEYAKKCGIDVIVTDHHECQEKIPETIVVNPKRDDCSYPFKFLSGCGVAFKLIQALWIRYNLEGFEEFLDIAAIGTIADVVSLTDENRIIVKFGLEKIAFSDKCGIKALLNVAGIGTATSANVAFQIAPRINAVGRLSNAQIAVELFTTQDFDKAMQIAKFLEQENRKRQEIEEDILKDAEEQIEEKINLKEDRVIVLSSKKWHIGVVGIVASRLVEKYGRPAILICEEKDIGRGSGRSLEGFNLFENINSCREMLIKFGGHEMAAGLSIEVSKIESFRVRINEIASLYDSSIFKGKLLIDMEVYPKELNLETARLITSFEPFGMGNASPVFLFRDISILNKRCVGKGDKHIKINFKKDEYSFEGIFFNGNSRLSGKEWERVDIAFNLSINTYREEKVQFLIRDIRPNASYLYSLIDENYFKALKDIEWGNNAQKFDIDLILCNRDYVKEFIDLNKGYILVSSLTALKELKDYLDSIDISLNRNNGNSGQIILCPLISEIDFADNDVLIYDFLPKCKEYSIIMDRVKGKVFQIKRRDFNKIVENYINMIKIDSIDFDRFLADLKREEIKGTVIEIGEKYNINSYKAYSMIMHLKKTGAINIYVKDYDLKIKLKDNFDCSRIDRNFQIGFIQGIKSVEENYNNWGEV